MKDSCKSHSYQYIFYEIQMSDDVLSLFPDNTSSNQSILELTDKLFKRVEALAPSILTDKQYKVFEMYYLNNKSTPSIARLLGINVSCVRNQLKGTKNNKGNNGVLPKLKNFLKKDKVCIDILKKISELSE